MGGIGNRSLFGIRRISYRPLLPSQLHLWNWYEILELDNQANDSEGEGQPRGSPRASQSTRHIATMGFKKERIVIVVVISLSGKLRALYTG